MAFRRPLGTYRDLVQLPLRSEPLLQRRVVGWFVCHIIRRLTGCAPSTNLETTFFRSWLSTNPGYGSNPFDRSSSLRSQRKLFPGENVHLFNISGWPCVLLLFSLFVSMSHHFVTISDPYAVVRAGPVFLIWYFMKYDQEKAAIALARVGGRKADSAFEVRGMADEARLLTRSRSLSKFEALRSKFGWLATESPAAGSIGAAASERTGSLDGCSFWGP